MWTDPIVKEVRNIRRRIEAECDGDSSRILVRAMVLQSKFQYRLISKSKKFSSKNVVLCERTL